ncbi:MAG: acetate/propionate family kinase [Hydrogenophilus sp.]|nr:acetate/propionate family kinase [Hydrogenophilus sp.]
MTSPRPTAVLTLNAGSSSLKFALYRCRDDADIDEPPLLLGQIERIGTENAHFTARCGAELLADQPWSLAGDLDAQHEEALLRLIVWLEEQARGYRILATSHRVVHGGALFTQPVRVTPEVLAALTALIPLAPLHQPHNLRPIRTLLARHPDWTQIACFDTAFHRTQPWQAQMFPLPRRYWEQGIRRYGFHGLSYEYIAEALPRYLPAQAEGRVVVAHLGNGASLAALKNRRSIASTMGFTALDGLMMGTRSGTIDPGVLLYLLQQERLDAAAIEHLLYREAGLLGVSGLSADMRTLLASDHPHAREAIELFCYRIARELGSLVAALGGLDALIFTGGIGEHAPPIRARVAELSGWLDLSLDLARNEAAVGGDALIHSPTSRVAVAVIATDEQAMLARHAARLLARATF